ncbi:MAG: hypothetical protein O2807_00710 [bacterium]|nr:hypothetical protein [bacterium]
MDTHGVNPSPILPPLGGSGKPAAGERPAPASPAEVQMARILARNAFQPGKAEPVEAIAPRRSGPMRGGSLDIYA